MEIANAHLTTKTRTDKKLWAGRIISTLCVLFLLLDAIMKIIKESHHVEGSAKLGWSEHSVRSLGITLLVSTICYMIPRTAVLGAILLTGYLGGAIAVMARVGDPYLFPFIFGVLIWCGLFLRDDNLRRLIPFRKGE